MKKIIKKKSVKKRPYIQNPQSGLKSEQYKKIQRFERVKRLLRKILPRGAAYRRETGLPHDELPVADGNYDTSKGVVDHVVLHTTVCCGGAAANRFNTPYAQASSNYLVWLSGRITLFLEEYWTAYANGNYKSNQTSISIEHEDCGDYNGPRTPELYNASSKLVADICKFYGIPCQLITRAQYNAGVRGVIKHADITLTSTACYDLLDGPRIVKGAQAILNPTPSLTDRQKLEKIAALCVGTGDVHKWQVRTILQS